MTFTTNQQFGQHSPRERSNKKQAVFLLCCMSVIKVFCPSHIPQRHFELGVSGLFINQH